MNEKHKGSMFRKWLLTFIFRILFSIILIQLINNFFADQPISLHIGINMFNMAVAGLLGMPGLVLLYGISFLGIFYIY